MASIRKRPNRPKPWEAVYRDPGGRQRTRSFARKVDAQRFLTSVEHDVLTGRYIDPSAGKVTFAVFAEAWLASRTSDPYTVEGLRSRLNAHLLPAFGDSELRAIKPSVVQAWLAGLARPRVKVVRGEQVERPALAASTVGKLLDTLSAILGAAVEDQVLPTNPCRSRSVRAPTIPERWVTPWTPEQTAAVVAALPGEYAALVPVGVAVGVRQGEALGLAVDAVDFLRREVHVRQQVKIVDGKRVLAPTKGKRSRRVPLPDVVAEALAEHVRLHDPGHPEGLLFVAPDGGPVDRNRWNRSAWKPALRAAGVEATRDNGYHVLRHTYTSNLLQAGVSVSAVAKYLGHADGGGLLLRTYGHVMPQAPDQARAAMDTFLRSCEPGVSQEAER